MLELSAGWSASGAAASDTLVLHNLAFPDGPGEWPEHPMVLAASAELSERGGAPSSLEVVVRFPRPRLVGRVRALTSLRRFELYALPASAPEKRHYCGTAKSRVVDGGAARFAAEASAHGQPFQPYEAVVLKFMTKDASTVELGSLDIELGPERAGDGDDDAGADGDGDGRRRVDLDNVLQLLPDQVRARGLPSNMQEILAGDGPNHADLAAMIQGVMGASATDPPAGGGGAAETASSAAPPTLTQVMSGMMSNVRAPATIDYGRVADLVEARLAARLEQMERRLQMHTVQCLSQVEARLAALLVSRRDVAPAARAAQAPAGEHDASLDVAEADEMPDE